MRSIKTKGVIWMDAGGDLWIHDADGHWTWMTHDQRGRWHVQSRTFTSEEAADAIRRPAHTVSMQPTGEGVYK